MNEHYNSSHALRVTVGILRRRFLQSGTQRSVRDAEFLQKRVRASDPVSGAMCTWHYSHNSVVDRRSNEQSPTRTSLQTKPIHLDGGKTSDSSKSASRQLFHLDAIAEPKIQIRGLELGTPARGVGKADWWTSAAESVKNCGPSGFERSIRPELRQPFSVQIFRSQTPSKDNIFILLCRHRSTPLSLYCWDGNAPGNLSGNALLC